MRLINIESEQAKLAFQELKDLFGECVADKATELFGELPTVVDKLPIPEFFGMDMDLIDRSRLINSMNAWALQESPIRFQYGGAVEYTQDDMQHMVYKTIRDATRGIEKQPRVVGCDTFEETFPKKESENDPVKHPAHYTAGKIEVWDFIADQDLDYFLGNAVKYICRCGRKTDADKTQQQKSIEDLEKAVQYLRKKIEVMRNNEI